MSHVNATASEALDTSHEPVQSIFKDVRFLLLWFTLLASGLSVSFFVFATNWYVVDYLKLEPMLGLLMMMSTIPRLIFMLIGGVIADRMSKAWVMFISDTTKGLLLIGLIALLLFDSLSIWVLIGFAFIFGILDAFFWPASSSLLPALIKKEQLMRANSVLDMTRQSSLIIGPLAASLLLGFGSYALVFGVTSLLLLLAGIVDLVIKKKTAAEQSSIDQTTQQKMPSMFSSIKEGLRFVAKTPFLIALMSSAVLINLLFAGPFQVGLPLYAKNALHGNELTYSLLTGSLAAGMLIGTTTIGILNLNKKRGLITLLAILSLAVTFLLLSLSKVLWLSMMMALLAGASAALANVPMAAMIQAYTPQEYMGRVFSLLTFSAMGLTPVSYAFVSFAIGLQIPIQTIMLISATLLCVLTLCIIMKAKALREVN